MQIQMQKQMNRDEYFIYKENMQAAIKRHGDADILMMTSIPFHCLFMPYLPSVTRLFSSTFETIKNLVLNTKLPVGAKNIFIYSIYPELFLFHEEDKRFIVVWIQVSHLHSCFLLLPNPLAFPI